MKLKPRVKLVISLVLSILLIFPTALLAESAVDYEGHYAEDSIKELFEKGIITGYVDGSFKPDREISRAEFMAIVNRAFNFNEEAEIDFADVKEGEWHYEHVARAVKAGYIKGFTDGTMRPTANISRQEAAVVIARILDLERDADPMALANLKDADKIQEWSAKGIAAIISKGYISVNKEGAFEPAENLTRADMAIAVAKSYTKGIKKLYTKSGIFRGGIIDGNVKIDNKNITLMDTEITGDLILGEGIGDGDVRLYNVKVKGETIVKGGGENSIVIENCEFTKIIIVKVDGKIRVLVKGNTTIDETEVQSGARLETDNVTGEGFGYVTIAEGLEGDTLIELIGNFENIEIQAEGVQIQASGGTIENLTIAEGAKDVEVDLAKDSKVGTLTTNVPTTVTGAGKIETAKVNTEGTKIDAPVTKVEAAPGVKVDVPKKETPTPAATTPSGPSRSDRDDRDDTSKVSAISVSPKTVTLTVGNTRQLGVDVTTTGGASKAVTWSSDNENVAIVDKDGDVTAVAAGETTITATSDFDKSKYDSCDVTVITKEQAAEETFIEAATLYDPESKIYTYSFDGENLDIGFDFSSYIYPSDLLQIISDVQTAAGEFLEAVFADDYGNASEVKIDMNDQTIELDNNNYMEKIVELAKAVFKVGDGTSLKEKVEAFVENGEKVTADFTMAVTNQEGVTFTLDGLTATFTNDTKEVAKEAFLEAATLYDPESKIYTYSFDGESLDIWFDFSSYDYPKDLLQIISDVQSAAGKFLEAVFDENYGDASEVKIGMHGRTIELDKDNYEDQIVELAKAVFEVGDGNSLKEKVEAFLEDDEEVTAHFIMTVTNQNGVTFTLEGLVATFKNVTKEDD